ncbi:response regulator [bacterium]|nr:MAG: response regulator [bacterium]
MSKKKVLVVDDEPNILLSLEFILEEEGFEVKTAGDGEEALEIARSFSPDIVLLDVAMPRRDGYEVCRILKEEKNPARVIMLTAKGQPLERKKGLEVGADAYVSKPFHAGELVAEMRALLEK